MIVDVKLYVDNDSRVVVRPLLDGLTPITGATVTIDLLDEFGDEVTPQQQLNEMPETVPVTLEDGTVVDAYEYRTVIDRAVHRRACSDLAGLGSTGATRALRPWPAVLVRRPSSPCSSGTAAPPTRAS